MEEPAQLDLVTVSAEIVAAYLEHNSLPAVSLPGLITQVHGALVGLSAVTPEPVKESAPKLTPSQIRKSITPDALISFIDGKAYKTLRRHLSTHGLTIAAYLERYGLPADYPTVAPSYSAKRSQLAKGFGLGLKSVVTAPEPAEAPVKARRTTRSRKVAEPA